MKEELKELKSTHKKAMNAQIKKYEGFEELNKKLQDEYEKLCVKYERIKKSHKSDSEIDKLTGILADVETKYTHEKENNRKLQSRCRGLEERVAQLEVSKVVSRESKSSV